ncbi:hypothetical protein ACGFJT_42115 [Actinomadura geliboluensis]|uniref:hypothetical protein n=1 Tax=Actinomadura geliboluensis TaxID=882440 RepID=UPI00371115FF
MTPISLNVVDPATRNLRTLNDDIPDDSVDALVAKAKEVKKEGGPLCIVLVIPRPHIAPHNLGGRVTPEGLNALEEMIAKSATHAR